MGWLTNAVSQGLGSALGSLINKGSEGRAIGEAVSSFLPFKKGGRVHKVKKEVVKKEVKKHYKKSKKSKKK